MRTLFGFSISRVLIAGFSVLVLTLSVSTSVNANAFMPGMTADPAAPQSRLADGMRAPLLLNVQYWGCERCRNYCYRAWRIRCGYSPFCRRNFVLCMRDCWYRFCR